MWPNYYPKQCPPVDAREDNLTVFRLVSNIPPTPDDFLPTIKEQPHRTFTDENLCIACGVSVFKRYEDIVKKRDRFRPLRHKKVATGNITSEDGLVKETGEPSHVTWWPKTNNPHTTFLEVGNDVAE